MPSRPTDTPADEQRQDARRGDDERGKGERIAKLLARAGIASRREVERMIVEGRVARDGVAIDTPATVLASLHGITVDGRPVAAPPPARLFVYHKPVGLLVTERDPAGRPTIYDRLPAGLPRVVPVGRLDLATEGLLLLTTDGGLKRQLELPATGVERTYRARAYGPVSQAQLEELIHGIEIDGVRYGSIDANLERRTGANGWIEMTLTEGKNREVRRVLEHLGLQVGRLIRTRYGPFELADLPPGEVGEIRQHDLVAFRRTLKSGGGNEGRDLRVAAQPLAPPPQLRAEAAAPPRARPGPDGARPEREPRAPSPARTGRPARSTAGAGTARREPEHARRPSPAPGRRPAPPGRDERSSRDEQRGSARAPSATRDPAKAATRRPAAGEQQRGRDHTAADRKTRVRPERDDRAPRAGADRADHPASKGRATRTPPTSGGRAPHRAGPEGAPGTDRPRRGGPDGGRPGRPRPSGPPRKR